MTSLKALGMGDKNKMETGIGEEAEHALPMRHGKTEGDRDADARTFYSQLTLFREHNIKRDASEKGGKI